MRSLYGRLHRRYGKKITGAERQAFVAEKRAPQERKPAAAIETMRLALDVTARPRVAIVGGGLAGLMAACELVDYCDVTVFEARDRFGGRVWSRPRSSGLVEAGGELLGYNHPIWLNLAKEFELGLSVITSDSNFDALDLEMPLYLDGKKRSDRTLLHVFEEMTDAFNSMSRRAEGIDPQKPWRATNAEKLDQRPLSDWIANLNCSRLTKIAIEEQFTNDAGQTTDQQSFLANLAVVKGGALPKQRNAFFTQTETLRCSEGNDALAKRLADKTHERGGKAHISTPVHAIHIDEDHVIVEAEGNEPKVVDYVILAIPPSLWPAAENPTIAITPELPRDYYVTMGKAVKYLSPLKRRFWIKDGLAPTATSNQFGVTWEGTDNQIAAPGSDVELNLFAGGPVAQDALNQLEAGGTTAVDQFYRARIGAVYPGYAASLSKPPDFMAWPHDPWTRAGYSCPAPGEVCRAGPLLAKAFHKRLFFAGEHTCFAYFGYMEGALQSGKRAASDLLKAIFRRRNGMST